MITKGFPAAILAVAALLWIGTAQLSSHVIVPDRPPTLAQNQTELPPALVALRSAAEVDPANISTQLRLSDALVREGVTRSDAGLLMQAVQGYLRVLERDNRNADALLGVATVSFESGVLDKAADYYQRYLALRPADDKVQSDYALTLLQMSRVDEAVSLLETLAKRRPEFFPARLSLALAYKVAGNRERARQEGDAAARIAPDEEAKRVVTQFIANIDRPIERPATSGENAELVSPATVVDHFFKNHPIIGPKIAKITWQGAGAVNVFVRDFPVEAMPETAKEKFLQSMKKTFADLPRQLEVKLIDEETNRELLTIAAGRSVLSDSPSKD